jgi:methylamine dehydrogenase heavy chain
MKKLQLFALAMVVFLSACDQPEPQAQQSEAIADSQQEQAALPVPMEIAPESIGRIETLPATYPPHWILLQDAAFFHFLTGKVIVVDADSDDPATRVKGMFNTSFIGQFVQAQSRPEMYVVETFHSRGTRGERTDVLTVWHKETLAPIAEVIIPAKRFSGMPTNYNLQLVDSERLAVAYNFTPATSVTVVDIVDREFLAEIPIPGCSLVYPMKGRAFASMCTNGTMIGVEIAEDGTQASMSRTEVFFDANNDPLMEKAAMVDGVAYFPSFLGRVVPVDLNGSEPAVGEEWSLLGADDSGWRPGGLGVTATDTAKRIYVLMHPEGYEGSHKDPGVEVWVFDTETQTRVDRIALALPAISIGVTRDDDPLLVTTNINLEVDVYSVADGEYRRTLSGTGANTVFQLHGSL